MNESSFEHQKHMFKLMGKEISAILGAPTILIWTYAAQSASDLLSEVSGSRNFVRGGPGQSDKKEALITFFFSPQLILQKSNGQFQRNLSFFKVPEGVQHFPGGGGGHSPIAYSL